MKLPCSTSSFICSAIFLLFAFFACNSPQKSVPQNTYHNQIKQHRIEMNAFFKDPNTSPLEAHQLRNFNNLSFFPINESYRVQAKVIIDESPEMVVLQTSKKKERSLIQYAKLQFSMEGQIIQIYGYKDPKSNSQELFVPFTDATNSVETYGGGRYLDVFLDSGDSTVIDFNLAYFPYCAFNHGYSCPIPPAKNSIDLPITAGQKW